GAYKIWGIQLDKDTFYKQKLPKEAVVHKINKKAILPTPKLAFGTATLKGKILDYQKEMMQQMKMHIESPALNVHNEQ
ncbi:TlpA family protein disulfide reductase, partial [Phocaeicola dorei]|nr:TlpA family protein disulfide reductase [Phocaeicola dorei]